VSSDLPQQPQLEPRLPAVLASAVFTAAALLLCAPIFAGRFLVGPSSDQYGAGFAFREFGARMLRETGAVPEWNPFLFGGMPFIAAMHGDIYYPTALLRRVLPTDTAMNLGFFLHFIIAGLAMYALLRYLRSTWTGAVVGGIAYQLSGILASMVKPGHDGKLFVSALAPLAFLALLVAVRDGKRWGYALLAAVTGLCLVSPHYQMTYYLLVTSGVFALWLAFLDPERRPDMVAVRALAAAALAVGLGVACSAVQALPFLEYIPFSPRGAGGPSAGWEYATSFSLPIEELATTLLPQFNGVLEQYWGQNFFKLHTEYVGALVLPLAVLGLTDRDRGPVRWGFLAVLVLALLVAFGSHTPFYRAWYEIMPMMKKVRAPGMAFFLVAMSLALFAGFGTDRLMRRFAVTPVFAGLAFGIPAVLGLLGAVGALQPIAEALAPAELMDRAVANADALRAGGVRLLVVALLGTIAAVLIAGRRLKGFAAAAALMSLVTLDLWSIDRQFFAFSAPAAELYAKDAITERLSTTPMPYRVLDPFPGTVYEHSILMGLGIPQVFGYHGNQLRFYDDVWGGKNIYANLPRLHLWDLWAVRYLLLPEAQAVPGYHKIVGPITTAQGRTGVLFERDSLPDYARVVAAAVKVADDQAAATVADPRFPVSDIVILPDTVSGDLPVVQGNASLPPLTPVTAKVTQWAPGSMRLELSGADARPTYVVVSENWYPGWSATVDGAPAPVLRGNAAMITVPIPPRAKAVELRFHLAASDRGRMISLAAVALVLLLAATSSLGGGRPRPPRATSMPAVAAGRRAA
jgi:hypothetical protein